MCTCVENIAKWFLLITNCITFVSTLGLYHNYNQIKIMSGIRGIIRDREEDNLIFRKGILKTKDGSL